MKEKNDSKEKKNLSVFNDNIETIKNLTQTLVAFQGKNLTDKTAKKLFKEEEIINERQARMVLNEQRARIGSLRKMIKWIKEDSGIIT